MPDRVRVHDDPPAALAAAQMGARGLTLGRDVYVGGDLGLDSPARRDETLGHELAHVAQSELDAGDGGGISVEDDAARAGQAFARGEIAPLEHATRATPPVARADELDPATLRRVQEIMRSASGEAGATGLTAELLRNLYNSQYGAIQTGARGAVNAGGSAEDAARAMVNARNALKESVRGQGPGLWAWLARLRNRFAYGNPVGPSYEQLAATARSRGVPEEGIAEYLLSRGTNQAVNRFPRRASGAGVGLAGLAALLDAYASYREGRPAGQIGLRSLGTFGGALALPGMYGGAMAPGALGMRPGSWGGGTVDFFVNITNAALQLAGAPAPVTSVTQTGAELTPSSTMFAGIRSAVDMLHGGITEGSAGLERVHQEQLRGGGGGVVQGYAALGGLLSGEDLDFLASPEAGRGDYGIFVEAGNYWGDVLSGDKSVSRDLREIWDFITE